MDRLTRKVQYWLRDHRDRRAGGYQLIRIEGRPKRWQVRPMSVRSD
jgi:hypothetical protein